MALTVSLNMESNALKKSTNKSVTLRFFAYTPSKIQLIVIIYDAMDRFLQKPIWFFFKLSWLSLSLYN